MIDYQDQRKWSPQTQMVRGATERSQFDETNEAIFLSSGYVYKTAEEAEKSFKNEIERYVYSRFRNPTVSMFEKRLALIEGAEEFRAMAICMATVFAALASPSQRRLAPCRLTRAFRLLSVHLRRVAAAIWNQHRFR